MSDRKRKTITCVNLFQPWADAIIHGKLPILARSFSTSIRGTVGIAATEGFDGILLAQFKTRDLTLAENTLTFGRAIGTAEIIDCQGVRRESCWRELECKVGRTAAQFYPAHLMPQSDELFFWTLANPKRFAAPRKLAAKGITWSRVSYSPKPKGNHLSKDHTFWGQYNLDTYIRLNKEMRRALKDVCASGHERETIDRDKIIR